MRGKLNAPIKFGAKLDISIYSDGDARIEILSFDAYNGSGTLKEAVEHFKERTGSYPKRVRTGASKSNGCENCRSYWWDW